MNRDDNVNGKTRANWWSVCVDCLPSPLPPLLVVFRRNRSNEKSASDRFCETSIPDANSNSSISQAEAKGWRELTFCISKLSTSQNRYKYHLIVGLFCQLFVCKTRRCSTVETDIRHSRVIFINRGIRFELAALLQVHASNRSILVTRTIVKCNTWPAVH